MKKTEALVPEVVGKEGRGTSDEGKMVALKDSEPLRILATEALGFHFAAKGAHEATIVNALGCGLRLLQAKERLEHGGFLKWQEKYCPEINRMTAFRYMQLTGKMLIEGYSEDGKCNTVLHLKDGHAGLLVKMLSAAPSAFTPEHVRKIVPKIRELVEGRTLSQLYFDFGVTKPRQTKDVKVHKRLGPAPTPSVYATDWVDRALAVLGQVGTFEKHLEEADLNRIVDGLKWTLECLGAGEQLHAEFRVIEPQDLTREGKSDEGRVSSVGGGR